MKTLGERSGQESNRPFAMNFATSPTFTRLPTTLTEMELHYLPERQLNQESVDEESGAKVVFGSTSTSSKTSTGGAIPPFDKDTKGDESA